MFQVGQQVVCVRADRSKKLKRGRIYTIDKIVRGWAQGRLQYGVAVCEVSMPQPYAGFVKSRFRPVRKTDISVFTSMLVPAPKRKRAALAEVE